MMQRRERDVAWDSEFWVDDATLGTISYLSGEKPDGPPVILVPDGSGDYREHQIVKRPKGRLGF